MSRALPEQRVGAARPAEANGVGDLDSVSVLRASGDLLTHRHAGASCGHPCLGQALPKLLQ